MYDSRTPSEPTCKYCGSKALTRYGKYKNSQRYFCKSCGRKMKSDSNPFHMKKPAEYIYTALELFYTGKMIKEIRNYLYQKYGYYPQKKVLYNWIYKYTGIATSLFQNYQADTGPTWILGETIISVDGPRDMLVYDILDLKTRFLLCSLTCQKRTAESLKTILIAALARARNTPREIIIDNTLPFQSELPVILLQSVIYTNTKTSDNDINDNELNERFHGSFLNGGKAIRAFKNAAILSRYVAGWTIYYNFFRPHPFLNGKTPAEEAGIQYRVKNWRDLVLSSYEILS